MRDLFSILVDLDRGKLKTDAAVEEIATWDRRQIRRQLDATGLSGPLFPQEPRAMAKLLVGLHAPETAAKAKTEPKTLKGMASGEVFDGDAGVVFRFATRKGEEVNVWDVVRKSRGRPVVEHSFRASTTQIRDAFGEIPEWLKEEKQDDPHHAPGGDPAMNTEIATRTHRRVDIKLVYWIPYSPNNEALRRKLPAATGWRDAAMTQSMRMAARAMLATGNEPPPSAFPNAGKWQEFLEKKEYRGALYRELFMCCLNGGTGQDIPKLDKVGFTPPRSGAKPEDLHQDHLDHQSDSSMATGLILESIFALPNLPGIPDRLEDVIEELRNMNQTSNESFTEGEKKNVIVTPMDSTDTTISGSWEFQVRVGKAANLLNYLLTGRVVKWQGTRLRWRLDCANNKLKLEGLSSPIPSVKLYVNNEGIDVYDMLTAPWHRVDACFRPPRGTPPITLTTFQQMEEELSSDECSPLVQNWSRELDIRSHDGCPYPTPTNWLYYGGGV